MSRRGSYIRAGQGRTAGQGVFQGRTGQIPKLSLGPDFAAQRTWEKPPPSVTALQTWLFAALLAALMATAGLFLIFHAHH